MAGQFKPERAQCIVCSKLPTVFRCAAAPALAAGRNDARTD